MSQPSQPGWRELGDRLAARYAHSAWRLPVLLLATTSALLVPLYLVRGLRLVRIGVLGLAGLMVTAVCFAHPFATLVASLFVLFSGLDLYLPGPVGTGLLFLTLARLGFDALGGKRIDWGRTSFRVALVVLLAVALTSVLVARSTGFVLIEVRNIVLGLGLYVALSQWVDRPRHIVAAFSALVLGIGVASLLPLRGLVATGGLGALGLALAGRFGGLGTDPNIHAGEVNCAIPLLVVTIGQVHGWRRWGLVVLLPVFIGSVILSQSRVGVAVLALVVLVLLLRSSRIVRGVAALGLLGLGGLALSLPDAYWVRFVSIAQMQGIVVDRSLLLRQHMLHVGWDVFREHPWIGVGLGNLRTYTPHYMLGEFKAHNTYLEVAASLGILGIAAYLAWAWSGLAMAWGAAARWRAEGRHAERALAESIVIALLAFFATALTLSIEFSLLLWILLGFANAARRCAEVAAAPGREPM